MKHTETERERERNKSTGSYSSKLHDFEIYLHCELLVQASKKLSSAIFCIDIKIFKIKLPMQIWN